MTRCFTQVNISQPAVFLCFGPLLQVWGFGAVSGISLRSRNRSRDDLQKYNLDNKELALLGFIYQGQLFAVFSQDPGTWLPIKNYIHKWLPCLFPSTISMTSITNVMIITWEWNVCAFLSKSLQTLMSPSTNIL